MLEITARVQQPMSIGTTAADMRRSTQRFVPGSAVRGAYAARWLTEHGDYQTSPSLRRRFIDLFERPDIRFGPLFAADGQPVSLATRLHKYGPTEGCQRTTWNAAVEPAIARIVRCPDCQQTLEPSRGDVDGVATSDRIRVALSDDETAQHGMLYSRESIDVGTTLLGYIHGDDPWLAAVTRLRLGGKRSTSGAVTLTVRIVDTLPVPTLLDDGRTVIVWLASPGVFVDTMGRPSDCPSEEELSCLLGVHADIEATWVRRVRVGGWHIASGLPKPVEIAVQAGSTYRIRCTETVSDEGLQRLADVGLGLRRNEGFGWVGPLPDGTPPPLQQPGRATTDRRGTRAR
jgi:CRISPR-associated protein Csx10